MLVGVLFYEYTTIYFTSHSPVDRVYVLDVYLEIKWLDQRVCAISTSLNIFKCVSRVVEPVHSLISSVGKCLFPYSCLVLNISSTFQFYQPGTEMVFHFIVHSPCYQWSWPSFHLLVDLLDFHTLWDVSLYPLLFFVLSFPHLRVLNVLWVLPFVENTFSQSDLYFIF